MGSSMVLLFFTEGASVPIPEYLEFKQRKGRGAGSGGTKDRSPAHPDFRELSSSLVPEHRAFGAERSERKTEGLEREHGDKGGKIKKNFPAQLMDASYKESGYFLPCPFNRRGIS
jgi:hypothetical protein